MLKTSKTKESNKQVIDTQVELLYESSKVQAFKVTIREGVFTVIDYTDRKKVLKADTEVYYARYNDVVKETTSEFKKVNSLVNTYVNSRRK